MGFPGTAFAGPVISGDQFDTVNSTTLQNTGFAVLSQFVTINAPALPAGGTAAVTALLAVPQSSWLITFHVDQLIPFNSATSAALSIGTLSTVGAYVSGLAIATVGTGRLSVTFGTSAVN